MGQLRRAVLVGLALLCVGCGLPSEPAEVFDAYLESFAVGDAERMWKLSSPSARADVARIKQELMKGLTHEDAAVRLEYEGTLGTTAEDVAPLEGLEFFKWAVGTIRRRLGAGWLRNALARWQRIRIEPVGQRYIVVYRWGERISRMPLARVDGDWRVDQSPFPAAGARTEEDEGENSEVPVNEVDPYDEDGTRRW